jgi:hypothetical protein
LRDAAEIRRWIECNILTTHNVSQIITVHG